MPKTKNEIYEMLAECSGPHTNIEGNTNRDRSGKDLYATFHFPEFSVSRANAGRDTLVRFQEYKIPLQLQGYSVYDLGSNIGAISLECARRNCEKVVGFEYSLERIAAARELARFVGVDNICSFVQVDFNNISYDDFSKTYPPGDMVFCCALDAYIDRIDDFYRLVSQLTKGTCYFETNSSISRKTFIKIMKDSGFSTVIPIGTSKSDKGYGRQSYVLGKERYMYRYLLSHLGFYFKKAVKKMT